MTARSYPIGLLGFLALLGSGCTVTRTCLPCLVVRASAGAIVGLTSTTVPSGIFLLAFNLFLTFSLLIFLIFNCRSVTKASVGSLSLGIETTPGFSYLKLAVS